MWIDRRWLFPGLVVSGLLNIFLIGILAGHFYVDHDTQSDRGPVVSRATVNTLPDDEKKKFFAVMATRHEAILAARKAQQTARRALETEIAAATYDSARMKAAFADLRQANLVLQEVANAALVEALATLSPASRAALIAHPAAAEGCADHP